MQYIIKQALWNNLMTSCLTVSGAETTTGEETVRKVNKKAIKNSKQKPLVHIYRILQKQVLVVSLCYLLSQRFDFGNCICYTRYNWLILSANKGVAYVTNRDRVALSSRLDAITSYCLALLKLSTSILRMRILFDSINKQAASFFIPQ